MTERYNARLALLAPLVASGLALSGCMGSPTYGTDKTAGEQLVGDLTGAVSFAPKHKDPIDYKPRPELVKPAPGRRKRCRRRRTASQTASAEWPESPEQRRARLRADATAHQNDPSYQSEIVDDVQTDPASVKKAMANRAPATRRPGPRRTPTRAAPPKSSAVWPTASRAIPTPANI